jgi:hypothetical protein
MKLNSVDAFRKKRSGSKVSGFGRSLWVWPRLHKPVDAIEISAATVPQIDNGTDHKTYFEGTDAKPMALPPCRGLLTCVERWENDVRFGHLPLKKFLATFLAGVRFWQTTFT